MFVICAICETTTHLNCILKKNFDVGGGEEEIYSQQRMSPIKCVLGCGGSLKRKDYDSCDAILGGYELHLHECPRVWHKCRVCFWQGQETIHTCGEKSLPPTALTLTEIVPGMWIDLLDDDCWRHAVVLGIKSLRAGPFIRCLPRDPDDKRQPKWFPLSQAARVGRFTQFMLMPGKHIKQCSVVHEILAAHVRQYNRGFDLPQHLVKVVQGPKTHFSIPYQHLEWSQYFPSLQSGMIMHIWHGDQWRFILLQSEKVGCVFDDWTNLQGPVVNIDSSLLAILGTRPPCVSF